MKFATASEHRDFFRKNHLIEFDHLLLPEQADLLVKGIENALAHRLKISPEKVKDTPSEKLFLAGRDLWRENVSVKKLILQSSFGEIASELIEEKPVRIAYDQLIPKKPNFVYSNKEEKYYSFLHTKHTLIEMSGLQGMLCGLMLRLSPSTQTAEPATPSLFSNTMGSGVFFRPDIPIDFLTLPQQSSYLLITYCRATTVYTLQQEDSHPHELKKYGYSFGDKLTDALNPVIFR